jgi:hypothetical protein
VLDESKRSAENLLRNKMKNNMTQNITLSTVKVGQSYNAAVNLGGKAKRQRGEAGFTS